MNSRVNLKMETGVNLNTIYERAMDIKSRCRDIPLNSLSDASVSLNGDLGTMNYIAPLDNGIGLLQTAALTPWSFKQLCSGRIGVPYQYMKKCIDSENPEIRGLFETNVNTWMEDYQKGAVLRLYTTPEGVRTVRGVLTPSYTVFDSNDVLKVVLETMNSAKYKEHRFEVKGYELNESGMQLRVVQPDMLDIDGEDIFAGFIIHSGDVGNRKLSVRFFLWKQVCTNGLVVARAMGNMLQKRHRGSCEGEFIDSITEVMDMLPDFIENAKAIIAENKGKELSADKLRHMLDNFAKAVKITDEEKEKIRVLTRDTYGLSRWGFINALTDFAQDERFDVDARTDIEVYAGNLLVSKRAA